MDVDVELELESGGCVRLTLPEPGDFASFYVLSLEFSGGELFWDVLERLLAAAGRPVCHFQERLRQQGVTPQQISKPALRRLLDRPGYGFGILRGADPALKEVLEGKQKLLFLRNPVFVLAERYRGLIREAEREQVSGAGEPVADAARLAAPAFEEFLRLPSVERMVVRLRGLAELRRRDASVAVFRYEHALSGWHAIIADLVATLRLPLDPAAAASIAASVKPAPSPGILWNQEQTAALEEQSADVMTAFGYARRSGTGAKPAAGSGVHYKIGNSVRAVTSFGLIFDSDPVLQGRLKPNTSMVQHVLGRRVVMEVDASGCRPVIGQPAVGENTLAAYGCSCTYGNAIQAEETFCSQLQGMFPSWRVENHGVPAYSTAQNLIQLEREARWNKVEFVTFCWIRGHLLRNVADCDWIQKKSSNMRKLADDDTAGIRFPRAALDENGGLQMRSVRLPRHDLVGIDLSDFAPDEYYLDLVCFRLFERANAIVTEYGGHFFVTTLLQALSSGLASRLSDAGIPVVDASLSGQEYTCLPDDGHPNALANRIYAERIRDYLVRFLSERRAAAATPVTPGLRG